MEPERPIEKLLRAWANKHLTGADDAFKLQPWVRRRLQAEVTKQFSGSEEESLSLWQLFRQQWAFLLVFSLLIFLGASLFMPALSKAKLKAKSVVAMSNLKQIGVAAQLAAEENNGRLPGTLDELTNGLISGGMLTDPRSGKPYAYVAGGVSLGDLQSNAVLAYTPSDGKTRAVLLADGSVQTMSEEQFLIASRRIPSPSADSISLVKNTPAPTAAPVAPSVVERDEISRGAGGDEPATTSPAAASARVLFAAKSPADPDGAASVAAEQSMAFAKTKAATAGAVFAFHTQETNASPVLAEFEVRQNGAALAVVDRDGSIYRGFIEPENSVAQNTMAAMTAPTEGKMDSLALPSASARTVFFRVTGENLTLKQSVVFAGSLIAMTNNASTNTPAQPALFSHSRIAGTATINATNTVRIDALPVTP